MAVIDEITWWRFEMQLQNHWIDWANPTFLAHDPEWEKFAKEQGDHYPELNAELKSVLAGINEAWIIKRAYGYEYHLEQELSTGA